MVLVGLDYVEVRTLTLGEAVLTVKLKLGGDNRVLTPAVHVKGSLGEHESASIRNSGGGSTTNERWVHTGVGASLLIVLGYTGSAGGLEHVRATLAADEFINSRLATESVDGVGKNIHGISVVERLGTHELVEILSTTEGGAVIYMSIRLDNPQELLAGVVEVELNLVRRRSNRLITSELELLN